MSIKCTPDLLSSLIKKTKREHWLLKKIKLNIQLVALEKIKQSNKTAIRRSAAATIIGHQNLWRTCFQTASLKKKKKKAATGRFSESHETTDEIFQQHLFKCSHTAGSPTNEGPQLRAPAVCHPLLWMIQFHWSCSRHNPTSYMFHTLLCTGGVTIGVIPTPSYRTTLTRTSQTSPLGHLHLEGSLPVLEVGKQAKKTLTLDY